MGGKLTGSRRCTLSIDEARARGANAVIAMRFDTSEMGDVWTEICAYSTAVRIAPLR